MKSEGISFLGAMGLLFIALKLMGFVDWSWWLVLLPLYGCLALALVIFVIAALVSIVFALADKARKHR